MPLSNFIAAINEKLGTITNGAKFYGLSTTIKKGNSSLPGSVNRSGETMYVGLDDKSPVIGYHKLNSIQVERSVTTKGYGDSISDTRNTYNCSLFIYLDQQSTGMTPDDYFLHLQANMPDYLGGMLHYSLISIRITNVILNTEQIFNAEYKGSDFKIPANKHLFQINYSVESSFKKGCFSTCPEETCTKP